MKSYKIPLSYDTLTDDQKLAFDMIRYGLDAGQNYLLTGDAGVGKSYVINVYAEFCDANGINMAKTAPTGTAATGIKGTTIHKMFKLPLTICSDEISSRQIANVHSMISYLDVIFIDEISMVRRDIFDAICLQIDKANEIRAKLKKNPIQVIASGDFGQLRPIITVEDRRLFLESKGYEIGNGCCYESPKWALMDLKPIILHTHMRQTDPDFCRALDNIRIGIDKDLGYITDNSAKSEVDGGIWVCGYKDTAAKKNALGLYNLPGDLLESQAVISGKAKISQTNMAENLLYKIGARVIMIQNSSLANGISRYYNGSLGTIVSASGGQVMIELDSGALISVGKVKLPFYEYKMSPFGRIEQYEIGSVTQYPFKIGYAITIHKAQGQTYEKMNLVPEIFAMGQLYTAVSRCRNLSNMYIQPDAAGNKLTPGKLMPDPDIVRFLINLDAKAEDYKRYFVSTIGA